MARTRGASGAFDYSGEGELLGKGGVPIPVPGPQRPPPIERVALDRLGNPISPAAYRLEPPRNLSGRTVLHGPGVEELPPPSAIIAYQADRSTIARNMEAIELAQLLELMLGPISVRVTPEVFATLGADLRRHFMPLRQLDLPAEEPPVLKRRPVRPRPDDDDAE